MAKDALGHGSNAHQGGVSAVGLSVVQSCARANCPGFSVSPKGVQPKSGYLVSLPGRTQFASAQKLAGPAGRTIVENYARKNADAFRASPNMNIGGWSHGGKLYMDTSEKIPDLTAARQMGHARNQIAIWDVAHQREIKTGGTGRALPAHQHGVGRLQ